MTRDTWTPDRIEILKSLWGEGLSAGQIAQALGSVMSRNSVIGKAHRLGLEARLIPKGFRQKKPKISENPIPDEAPNPQWVLLKDTTGCMYASGTNPYSFCNCKIYKGSYCSLHWVMTHNMKDAPKYQEPESKDLPEALDTLSDSTAQ